MDLQTESLKMKQMIQFWNRVDGDMVFPRILKYLAEVVTLTYQTSGTFCGTRTKSDVDVPKKG